MKKLIKLFVGNKEASPQKDFIWNMAGATSYAFSSLVLSFFMIRFLGADQGGVFAIAITVSQMMAFIAYYETRTYQVTDTEKEYSFGDYRYTKLFLCIIMMVACFLYVLIVEGEASEKALVILEMCVYRMIDGYTDLYEGNFQADGRLYLAGKEQTFRTLLSVTGIMICVVLTRNLVISLFVGIVLAFAGLVFFAVAVQGLYSKERYSLRVFKVKGILLKCFPLFLGSFLWSYILSAGRIAIDAKMTSDYQAYFQSLFLPVSVVNLCATFVMKPILPQLAETYAARDKKAFYAIIGRIVGLIMLFTVVCVIGAYLLGTQVLSILSGCDLSEYKVVLVILMVAGGLNACSYFLYYMLSVMRCFAGVYAGYILGAIFALLCSGAFVAWKGIMGASLSFLINTGLLSVIFLLFCMKDIRVHFRE